MQSFNVRYASGTEPPRVCAGRLGPLSLGDGIWVAPKAWVPAPKSAPAKIGSPLGQVRCMGCGSFSTSGPVVAGLTTSP